MMNNKGCTGTNVSFKNIELFQYISDIDINDCKNIVTKMISPIYYPFRKPGENISKNLIIAGNIGQPRTNKFLDFLYVESKVFKRVFFVLGEKEYGEFEYINKIIKTHCLKNVYVLNDKSFIIDNGTNKIKIIGSTKSFDYVRNEIDKEDERNELGEFVLYDKYDKYILITEYLPKDKQTKDNLIENCDYWIHGKTNFSSLNNKLKSNHSINEMNYFII